MPFAALTPPTDDTPRSPAVSHPGPTPTGPWIIDADAALLVRLRAGDATAYTELVDHYSRPMLRVALRYARSRAVAEEAVQETWLAVLRGVDNFEGRATLRTWIFRILVNQAQGRAAREVRVLPLTDVLGPGGRPEGDPYAEERLLSSSHDRWPGHWSASPGSWAAPPEDAVLTGEVMGRLFLLIAALPERQRQVVTLRDVEGRTGEEVCIRLGLQPTNQRVLLHRARRTVRAGLGQYLTGLA